MAEIFTLTLGDIDQYSATLATTPTLTGSRIVFTDPPSPKDGFDLILSEELRGKIETALDDACANIDDTCLETINNILLNPQTELEARQILIAGYSLAFLAALYFPIANKLINSKGVPVAIHAPLNQVGPIASAAQASTLAFATGTGTAMVTITRKPDVASTTASNTPHQTTFSSSIGQNLPGDIEIYIPEALGQRMTELIDRSQKCTIDDSFSGSRKARSLDFNEHLTGAICATKQVVLNASPGAAFEDLGSLATTSSWIPSWTIPEVQEAMEVVMQFAEISYQFINMNPSVALTMAAFVFMLIYERSITGNPIYPSIRIPGTELQGKATISVTPSITTFSSTMSATSTVSSSSSSSTQECSAYCRVAGAIKRCTTECPTMTGLPTAVPTEYAVRTMTVEPWIVPIEPQIPIKDLLTYCMPNEDTMFPSSAFNATYANFCEKADGSAEDVTWMVNAKGEQLQFKRRRFWIRESSNTFSDYKFALWWRPKTGENATDCAFSCEEAFESLVENKSCQVGDEGGFMAGNGGIDIGCGTYSFTIHHQIQSTVECLNHPLDAPKRDDVASGGTSVESAIQTWCGDNDGHQFSSNSISDNVYWRWGITQLDVPDRRSFWLRAKPHGDNQQASFVKDECIAALKEGLSKCDPDSDTSHGFTATVGTIDYRLDLSGVTKGDSPPWDEHPSFPAPEQLTAKGSSKPQSPKCWDGTKYATGRELSPDDLEQAIDAWCIDDAEIKGFGQYGDQGWEFPADGQPGFYPESRNPQYLHLGMETVENGAPKPYDDMKWCE
ncbi:hypothetical protein J4E82_006948 [Alternaria postmessia]|uniref:uncharacterized protein n=1 Tax=Alternaria postmessia TaxID=1187938 RepID=UPI002225AC29|nr:uncharacterized protein J4E82_006948 [Alternaria postmessia]KAI5374378.1 hypothetical protein J4E82_006948 [Alternaria postmessia]